MEGDRVKGREREGGERGGERGGRGREDGEPRERGWRETE